MKYRLLKDLFDNKAGTEFQVVAIEKTLNGNTILGYLDEQRDNFICPTKLTQDPDWFAPIEAEQKQNYVLKFHDINNTDYKIAETTRYTKPQAEAVATAITALLEYVNTEPKSQYVESKFNPEFVRAAEKARQLLQEGGAE